MVKDKSITAWFGDNLAILLADKIEAVYKDFDRTAYIRRIKKECVALNYTKRVELHAALLKEYLPPSYKEALKILLQILGEENPNETGMFTHYYWVLPLGKFVETYGLEHFDLSMHAIEEITKRNTGEYAIRPFIRAYPKKTIAVMYNWSTSPNFHLRRLASEGARPKLPWSKKLDTFIDNPEPVFAILDNLIEDDIRFVQKSVANNIADYLKVNKKAAMSFIQKHRTSKNKHTQWILAYATRKINVS